MKTVPVVKVLLWGQEVGALAALPDKPGIYAFQYAPIFVDTGIEVSPCMMPLEKNRHYYFSSLNPDTYHGLPGLIADALPDYFGNTLINEYLLRHGIHSHEITTLHRLLYIGNRAMGALSFQPAIPTATSGMPPHPILMAALVEDARKTLRGKFDTVTQEIIDIGSSAGGARAKAVIGWNPDTKELLSGQFDLPEGFEHWLIKFDGVGDDKLLGSTYGFGRVEYAHYLMAIEAGVTMHPCQLLEENGRAHFMTKRFDREKNEKIHMHSLCGMQHLDFNAPYTHSYEQYFRTILSLKLGPPAIDQAWIRCVFNVMIRNCDDHSKNFAFLMRRDGAWELAPAYDVCFSYSPNPEKWTHQHQMRINGKTAGITKEDLFILANTFEVRAPQDKYNRITQALLKWRHFADCAKVPTEKAERIRGLQEIL